MAVPGPDRPRLSARRKATSFRTTLLIWSLVLALIPMTLMAVQGFHCGRQAVTEAVSSDLRHLAAARAAQLEEWLQGRRDELNFLVQGVTLPPGCHSGCACKGLPQPTRKALDLLPGLPERLSESSGFAVLDLDGNVLGTTGALPDDWLEAVTGILPPPAMTVSTEPVAQRLGDDAGHLLLASLLRSPDRPASGYLVAAVDLEGSLTRMLVDRSGLGSNGSAYLLKDGGAAPGAGPGELLHSTKSGSGVWEDQEGDEVVGGFARVPALKAYLVVERKSTEALRWLEILARRALVVGLITALIVLVCSRFITDRLSRPLKTLAEVARRITSGDQLARVPALAGLELEEVGRAHNQMLDVLQQSRERIAQSAALAAVGELSTSIVHELRNPLSSVKMNLQSLCRKLPGDPVLMEQAQIARQQAERIEQLLEDLLDYGKPLSCVTRSVPLVDVLNYAVGSVGGLLQARGLELKVSSPEGRPRLETDPERLAQALENLLRNAIEASPEGAEIRLDVRDVRDVGVSDEGSGQVHFEIADQGPGLPTNGRSRLFQPFFSSKAGGTGLGLANVKKIVELLGGTVQAEDRLGGGALFRITLPGSPAGFRRTES